MAALRTCSRYRSHRAYSTPRSRTTARSLRVSRVKGSLYDERVITEAMHLVAGRRKGPSLLAESRR